MSNRTIGVVVEDPTTQEVIATIQRLERAGVPAVWMTSGTGGGDILTTYAAAAMVTERIRLGTSIERIWSRHPVTLAEQARTVWGIAPGRLALGLGPAHKASMEHDFGQPYEQPLGHLEDYLTIVKSLLQDGEVDFQGRFYTGRGKASGGIDVPVLASALRPKSFELCGRVADGAITWVCPLDYVRDVALPALRRGASEAGRPTPMLYVHVPVCLTDDPDLARAALNDRLGLFPPSANYARVFELAGFADTARTGWSPELAAAVMVSGGPDVISERLTQLFDWGADELVVTVLGDRWEETVALLAKLSAS